MKIIYINNSRLPTERAHGYQVGKMCEAFAEAGAEVELWYPARQNQIKEDVFTYYSLKPIFLAVEIKSFDWLRFHKYLDKPSFWLHSLFFFVNIFLKPIDKEAVIYTRNIEISWLFNLKKHKVVYECHCWPETKARLYKFLARSNKKVAVITEALKKLYLANGFKDNEILVAPDGVDLTEFNSRLTKAEARDRVGLPLDKKIVLYAGHLYEWKGAQVLADAACLLGGEVLTVFVGGTPWDLKKFQSKNCDLNNILITGHVKHSLVPLYLQAADVLVLPNLGAEKISSAYTSPLKLFEYMASGRPIVASALPSIREILNDKNSVLVESDSPSSLAGGIKEVLKNGVLAESLAKQALVCVKEFSWQKRAERIINFIS